MGKWHKSFDEIVVIGLANHSFNINIHLDISGETDYFHLVLINLTSFKENYQQNTFLTNMEIITYLSLFRFRLMNDAGRSELFIKNLLQG